MGSIFKAIWLVLATFLAGAVVVGAVIAFGMLASAIGILIAGGLVVMFIYHAWQEYRSNRKARK